MTGLLVGYAEMLLRGVHGQLPPRSLLLVETPEVIARRGLFRVGTEFEAVEQVLPVRRLETETVLAALTAYVPGREIDRVVPGTEVGVAAAAGVAHALGLPGPGLRAATLFRDKVALRAAADEVGLHQPAWVEVAGEDELRTAVSELGGDRFVLKPANRAGSLGVTLFDVDDDLTAVWRDTTAAAPARVRRERTRYLVEQRLSGPEVSVECLVCDGEIIFTNVTDKHVLPGAYPVEVGHQVPGPYATAEHRRLADSMRRLVELSGMGHGILHGEWILTASGPGLVECAARIPGDRIMELLDLAYGVPVTRHYLDLMAGGRPALPGAAVRGAAIRFLTFDQGTVREVIGVADAAELPGVHGLAVEARNGRRIMPVRASYDRVGHVIATGPSADDAWDVTGQAAGLIKIAMR